MSRYRKIDPRIWNDKKFRGLSDSSKLMFFMLLTHPNMTALGAMRATMPGLASEIGWTPEAFAEAFGEAFRKGMAEHDETACVVALPNFLKYNPPESPNVVKAWVAALDLLPECTLTARVLLRSQAYAEGMTEAFRQAFREAFAKAMPNQEQEQEQEQEKSKTADMSSAGAEALSLDGNPPKRKQTKEDRLRVITEDAIATFNASPLVKPNGGNLATVNPAVGREKRQKQVARCVKTASDICANTYGDAKVTRQFWEDYWDAIARDDFRSGRTKPGNGHANWRPDFDYLTKEDTMLKVFEASEAPA